LHRGGQRRRIAAVDGLERALQGLDLGARRGGAGRRRRPSRAMRPDRAGRGATAEGYLFPDTYKFAAKAAPEQILTRLVERHRQVFADLRRRNRPEAKKLEQQQLGWGDHEIVVLASIVEKETAAKHERPLIAGVFLNRLRFPRWSGKMARGTCVLQQQASTSIGMARTRSSSTMSAEHWRSGRTMGRGRSSTK